MRYFFDNGVNDIVVQRKYMGSYCDIYLRRDINETYFVSRNGYLLFQNDLEEKARQACSDLYNRFDWSNLQMVIVQSEIMPWSATGKNLIDNEFGGYLNVHQNHHKYLANSCLYEKIETLRQSKPYLEYLDYKATHSNKEVQEHFSEDVVRQYDSLSSFKLINLDEYKKYIDIYAAQLNHFGRDGDLYFKPFNIMKKVFVDGSEHIVNDNLSYRQINDDLCLNLTIENEEELNRSIQTVYDWFAQLEAENEEGIVIKPRQAFIKNVAPALKVRNNQYLVMIYGVDFHTRYEHYFEKRKTSRKLECSINDWMLNWELIKVKYSDIDKDNYHLKNIIYDRIICEMIEATLDTRL